MSSDDDNDYYVDDPFDKPASGGKAGGAKKKQQATAVEAQNNRTSNKNKSSTTPQNKDLRTQGGHNNNNAQQQHQHHHKPASTTPRANDDAISNALAGMNPEKEHYLTPADKILSRIKWDDTLNVREFEIGYEDRFKGLMFMSAARFRGDGGEETEGDAIPWHRVKQFVYKGRVVWDKEARINLVDDLAEEVRRMRVEETEKAQIIAATGLTSLKHINGERLKVAVPASAAAASDAASSGNNNNKNKNNAANLSVYQKQLDNDKPLKVVTYNILHDIFDADLVYTDLRIPLIIEEIMAQKPDVIFFQEVTMPRYKNIMDQNPILRNNYYWTMMPSQVSSSQVIGTRFPLIEAYAEQISRNKRRIFALMENPWAKQRGSQQARALPILLVNCHFLSDHGTGDSIARRLGEVKSLNQNMSGFPRVIIAGDFNFGDQNPESSVVFEGTKDAWLEEYKRKNNLTELPPCDDIVKSGGKPNKLTDIGGFTFDITRNPLANLSCEHHRYPRRLDRILVRAFNPVADSVKVFAIDPHPISKIDESIVKSFTGTVPADGKIYPSDHFGVCAELKRDDATFAGAGAAAATYSNAADANKADAENDDDAQTQLSTSNTSTAALASRIDPVVAAMSKAGGFAKFFRSALVFLPPASLYERVNRFRANNRDKAYPRWMPHFTILFPFVHPAKFGDAIKMIDAALQTKLINVQPFRIRLAKTGVFARGKNVVFLEPECVSKHDSSQSLGIAPMKAVFEPLQYLFPQCGRGGGNDGDDNSNNNNNKNDADNDDHSKSYSPHMTLGQTTNQNKDHANFLARVSAEWEPVEFDVSQFHLIAHLDGKEEYEVIHTFDLDSKSKQTAQQTNTFVEINKKSTASPAASSSSATPSFSSSTQVATAGMATVLEPPSWGSRLLKPYAPPDPLERWMTTVSIAKYARDAPTHISMLGGMYHIPGDLLNEYLAKWRESFAKRNEIAFYVEEVRGNPFRLYLDLDFDLSSEEPIDRNYALNLVREICIFTSKVFPGCDSTIAAFHCHGSASKKFADGSIPDPDDKLEDTDKAEVRIGKSGYRLYFQRIFVDEKSYDKYLAAVAHYLRRTHFPYPETLVRGVQWEDIVDKKAVMWDRGRLLGTIKRRKNIKRIYEFQGAVTVRGTNEVISKELDSSIYRQLYASTLRLWEVLPTLKCEDGKSSVLMDNEFTSSRLYSWSAECEAAAATAHEGK